MVTKHELWIPGRWEYRTYMTSHLPTIFVQVRRAFSKILRLNRSCFGGSKHTLPNYATILVRQERGKKMKKFSLLAVIMVFLLVTAIGVTASETPQQTVTKPDERRVTRVMVSGDSIVQAQPDTAIVTLSVVSQARQATQAQQQNASTSDAVVKLLKSTVGSNGEVKTSGYSLQPQRVYKEGQPPTITGYEARNSVTVTLNDLSKLGGVIDAASQAGANDISGISFTLRQDRSAKDRALNDATREAMSKAQVIAQALG